MEDIIIPRDQTVVYLVENTRSIIISVVVAVVTQIAIILIVVIIVSRVGAVVGVRIVGIIVGVYLMAITVEVSVFIVCDGSIMFVFYWVDKCWSLTRREASRS